MPTITISKTKIRRGTNIQRKQVIFDQGELVYTTDTKRLFVGTGTTTGGIVNGSQIHPPISNYYSLSTIDAEVGDLINVNNIFYQLTAADFTNINSWSNVGLKIDPTIFSYNNSNTLTLFTGSISASYLNPNTVLSGVKIQNGILQVNYNTNDFNLTGGALSIKPGGTNPYTLQYSDLSPTWFGRGLSAGASQIQVNPDFISLTFGLSSLSSTLQLNPNALSGTPEWPSITVDKFGRTTTYKSAIFDTLSGIDAINATFNGRASQNLTANSLSTISGVLPSLSGSYGPIPDVTLTAITALSTNGTSFVTITLSSAGFITFEGNEATRTGQPMGRFAIPIFSY
jgi:hypothetical protein